MNDTTVERIEKLQTLAALSSDDLDSSFTEESLNWLHELVRVELPGHELPQVSSPAAFASAIADLNSSRSAWSRRLGSLVVALHDAKDERSRGAVVEQLREFSRDCPWVYLASSADQKCRP
jgi:hypothetical protein